MSTGDGTQSYDLRKMEDIFSCLEIITMARGILYPVDENLAARLEKVSDALSAFSLIVDETSFSPNEDLSSRSSNVSQKEHITMDVASGKAVDPLDLLTDFPQPGRGKKSTDDDDSIIDILTGEKIR